MSEEFGVTVTVTTTAQMFIAPVVTKREKGKDEAILVLVPEREGSPMRVGVPLEEFVARKEATLVQIVQTEGPAHLGVFSHETKTANAEFYADEDIPEWLVDVSSDMFGSLGMNVSEAIKERQRNGIREANAEAEAEISSKQMGIGDMLREAGISGFKPNNGPAVEFDSLKSEGDMTDEEIEALKASASELEGVVEMMRAKARVAERRNAMRGAPDFGPVSDLRSMSQAFAMLRSIGVL